MALSRVFKYWIVLAVVFIIGLLWTTYFYFTLAPVAVSFDLPGTTAPVAASEITPVVIERGTGLREIADDLAGKGLIRSVSAFKLYAIMSGNAHQLKPGLYPLSPASSTTEIIRFLVAGPAKEISVLIPEGATVADAEAQLARYGVIHPGAISKLRVTDFYDDFPFLLGTRSFEGFLFPDTYRFYFDSDPSLVVRTMLTNYAARVSPLIADEGRVDWDSIPVSRRGIFTSLQITTMASMIEKEVPYSIDRKMVADVMYRRLKLGMPLQIDATVDYAKKRGDQYDTYLHYGLPPGPISNPGVDAIDAALNPRSTQFLYYLSDPKTKHTIFSKTFEEHKANKEKYLK